MINVLNIKNGDTLYEVKTDPWNEVNPKTFVHTVTEVCGFKKSENVEDWADWEDVTDTCYCWCNTFDPIKSETYREKFKFSERYAKWLYTDKTEFREALRIAQEGRTNFINRQITNMGNSLQNVIRYTND